MPISIGKKTAEDSKGLKVDLPRFKVIGCDLKCRKNALLITVFRKFFLKNRKMQFSANDATIHFLLYFTAPQLVFFFSYIGQLGYQY